MKHYWLYCFHSVHHHLSDSPPVSDHPILSANDAVASILHVLPPLHLHHHFRHRLILPFLSKLGISSQKFVSSFKSWFLTVSKVNNSIVYHWTCSPAYLVVWLVKVNCLIFSAWNSDDVALGSDSNKLSLLF